MKTSLKGPFYVVEHEYIGPNFSSAYDVEKFLNNESWDILSEPPRTNLSKEIRTNGWLGSNNDWSSQAHGEFETIDEARNYIESRLGFLTLLEDGDDDDDLVESYRANKETFALDVESWWQDSGACEFGVTAETSDEEIRDIAKSELANARDELNYEGVPYFVGSLEDVIREIRDNLRAPD